MCFFFLLYFDLSLCHTVPRAVTAAAPVLDTVPPHDYIEKDVTVPWQRYMDDPEWQELLQKATQVLAEHPVNQKRAAAGQNRANGIWLWGEGKLPSMPTLQERFGIQGSLLSAVDLLKGLGVNAGLDILNIPGATGYIDTNYQGKADAALESLKTQDFESPCSLVGKNTNPILSNLPLAYYSPKILFTIRLILSTFEII